jgi:glycosyltransferase involved in cell wall biosynthesis
LGIPWIADFRDPLFFDPSSRRSVGRTIADHWERRIVKHADMIIGVHEFMIERWVGLYGEYKSKFHFLPNGFDPDEVIAPLPLPRRSHRVLLHVGSLYAERTPRPVLASIARQIKAGTLSPSSIKVRLIGDVDGTVLGNDADLDLLRKYECIECIDQHIPRLQALRELAEADYLLLLDNLAGHRPYGLPAKIFEYVQMGRPILAVTRPSSPAEITLRKGGARYRSIRPDAPADVVDAEIRALLEMDTTPRRPSDWFYSQFDGRLQVERLAELLDGLAARSQLTLKSRSHSPSETHTCAE